MTAPSSNQDYPAYVRGQIQSLAEALTKVMFGDFTAVAHTQEPDEAFGYLCVMINVAINAARNSREELSSANEQLARTNENLQATLAERIHAEEATSASRRLLQAIIDNSTAVVYVKDIQGRYLLVNRRYCDLFHLDQEAVLGNTDHDIFPKEAADAFREMDQRVAAAGHALTEEETAPQGDGPHTYISVKFPLRDAASQLYAVGGISTDITERKHAEQKLQSQLAQLDLLGRTTRAIGERQDLASIFQVVVRSLEDHLPIDFGCVCLYDKESEVLTVASVGAKSQPLAIEMAMAERAHLRVDQNGLSRSIQGQLVYEPDIGGLENPFPERLSRGGLRSLVIAPLLSESRVFGVLIAARRAAHGFSSGDCEFLRQLSEHVALAASQAQVYADLQQAYDELRRTQRAVLEQERLRALGQMASGIAHDINNAISPITLYTESLLELEPGLSERGRQYLVTIQRAIDDVAQTVSRMKEFYRPREAQQFLSRVDLNPVIKQVVDLTRARWSDLPQQRGIVIDLRTDLAAELPAIQGAESEIRDALTNLIFNAVDAMPNGGPLTLRTSAMSGAVCVEICDAGVGMDEETRRRCIEPFFTTKGERGTGLGLAGVYGMVQRHSGGLKIESEPGEGTTVRLVFPILAPEPASTVDHIAPQIPTRRLRILVVDDDPRIIGALRDSLQGDGHRVASADGGQAGIDAFIAAEKSDEPFEVVITDLGMPYVDGRKVVSAIRAASRTTPIIVLTGWGERLAAENDLPPGVNRVLSKPPRLRELRIALAELTEGARHL
ncbi:MAG: PAS domain-containing protein [Hyphomonadaceae bacterium]|nr:PAS domain-containing protein [Hyphomonadaceae bacterium]